MWRRVSVLRVTAAEQLPPHLASLIGISAPVEGDEARLDAELEKLHERLQAVRPVAAAVYGS